MKIKYILSIIGLSCVLVGATSCEDVIDVEPEYVQDGSQIFNDLDDYEFALTGAYSLLRQSGYYNTSSNGTGTYSVIPDMMADNLIESGESLANFDNLTDWQFTAGSDLVEEGWEDPYTVISQANVVLRGIDEFADEDQERVNRLKGQALALRAYVHFDLLRYFGVEFERNSTELGIPYKKTVDFEETPARLTVSESYDNIFADLEQAEELLMNVDRAINTASNKSRIDLTAVRAMLARVSLYAQEYEMAEEYATAVIDVVSLADRSEFPEIWEDASKAEVIWSVPFSSGEGSPASNLYFAAGNRSSFRPAADFLATYNEQNDIRYQTYFDVIPTEGGDDRNVIVKFNGRGVLTDDLVDWKVFRVAEMYLIRAEARAMASTPDVVGALADLNELRAARISNYVPVVLAGQALIDAIAMEREKELVGEGHRWFDLKRTTRTVVREDCEAAEQCELGPDAREWVWPIPGDEILANPALADQQSPGY